LPTPDAILAELTALARDGRPLAVLWHAWLAAMTFLLLSGWRPPARRLARLLLPPLVSVAALSAIAGNPFNSIILTTLAVALARTTSRLPVTAVRFDAPAWVAAGTALIALGWVYPYFLPGASWMTYLYASPFGVLPCPTLSVAIGVTLAFANCRSFRWSATLALAGILYGAVGLFALDVMLDGVLLLAALALGFLSVRDQCRVFLGLARRGEGSLIPLRRRT
jgi:hypothetical protein